MALMALQHCAAFYIFAFDVTGPLSLYCGVQTVVLLLLFTFLLFYFLLFFIIFYVSTVLYMGSCLK